MIYGSIVYMVLAFVGQEPLLSWWEVAAGFWSCIALEVKVQIYTKKEVWIAN
jgi:hypothetical protein